MINIKSKEYNLSSLFQYDLLRDILLSLADYQNDIHSEILALKNQAKYHDMRISNLEEKNNIEINPAEFNINITGTNLESPRVFENSRSIEISNREENKDEEEEIKESKSNNNEKTEESKEREKEENKTEEKEIKEIKEEKEENEEKEEKEEKDDKEKKEEEKEKKEEKEEKDVKEEDKEKKEIKEENKEMKRRKTTKEKKIIKENLDDDEEHQGRKKRKLQSVKFGIRKDNSLANYVLINKSNSTKNSDLNREFIADMMKKIRENTEKISNLESEINKIMDKELKRAMGQFQKDIKNELLDNKSTITVLDNRINEIMQKNSEYDKTLEDLTVKTSNLDIFKMFQDSGDGNVDMAKILVKSLEERVFKKFEVIDLRYRQEAGEIMKTKRLVENLNIFAEKNEREIKDLKEGETKIKEELENLKNLQNLIDTNDKKYTELFEEKEINNDKKIEEFKDDFEKKIKEMEEQLKEEMEEIMQNMQKEEKVDENSNEEKNKYDEEVINSLEKKLESLRKKTNDLDNTLKLFIKDLDIDGMKKNLKDLQFELEQKLTKDSLKELYNLHLSDVDEITDLRENYASIHEDLKKNTKNITFLTGKMEIVLGNLLTLKENKNGPQKKILDLAKYVELEQYNESSKKINHKIEKIFEELESLRRDLNEMESLNKDYEKKERVNHLEEDVYAQLNERKTNCNKNKNDLYKQIKNLEVQIKAINEELKQKQDADSWILAKQPMKCFNCETCEANIKKEASTDEFISWNKYPPPNKYDNINNRFGRGFSHMLQMMTSDLINNIDNTTNINNMKEEENSYKNNLINNSSSISTNMDNNRHMPITKIATIERSTNIGSSKNMRREIGKSSVPKFAGRFKLPKMHEGNKKLKNDDSIPNFDEEKNNINGNTDSMNYSDNENRSPRIIKIRKKQGNQNLMSGYNSPPKIAYNNKNEIKPISSNKRNFEIYTNDVNKNFSQTNPIP